MERAINFFNLYYDMIIDWYDALTFLEQMGVLFGIFVGAFGIVALFIIRK
jgi:hypothetical protein